jgi:hypothetical protein
MMRHWSTLGYWNNNGYYPEGEDVIKVNANVWLVKLSLPPQGQRSWRENLQLTVLCESAQEALNMVMKQYPNATIHTVSHKGSDNVVVSEEVIKEYIAKKAASDG